MESGITSEAQAYEELVAGEVDIAYLTADATNGVTAGTTVVGQVFEYEPTGHNYINKTTAGVGKPPYVVCAEAKAITVDTAVKCIVRGKVNLNKLDATSQADADIKAALLMSGIIAVNQQS